MELNYGKQYERRCVGCGENFISICECSKTLDGKIKENFPRACSRCQEAYDLGLGY